MLFLCIWIIATPTRHQLCHFQQKWQIGMAMSRYMCFVLLYYLCQSSRVIMYVVDPISFFVLVLFNYLSSLYLCFFSAWIMDIRTRH
jgi:hypothetical protein